MVFKDYYKILDLKTIKVNKEEIKNAYRNQAKKYHPDINSESNDEIIKDINEAYKILSDTESKKKYDRLWISYIGKNESKSYIHKNRKEDIFEELKEVFFGTSSVKNKKNKNKKLDEFIKLELTIEEGYNGTTKYINKNNKEIKVVIPERTKTYDVIKIVGEGKKNEINSEEKGDLLIEIALIKDNDSEYSVNGIDLERKLIITPAEAVLGVKKEIDIFGEKMSVIIPKNVKNGYLYRVKNKGFISKTKTKGVLIIKIVIEIPTDISEEEIELYKKLYEIQIEKNEY